MFCGKKLTESRTADLIAYAFAHNIVIKQDGQYKSMYSKISAPDRRSDVFIATDFEDRNSVSPKLSVDLDITP